MPADTDLIKLYSTRILALAAEIPHHARLDAPAATVRKRSPLCGSAVTVDLRVEDGRIADNPVSVDFASVMQQLGVDVFGGQGWENYDNGNATPATPE